MNTRKVIGSALASLLAAFSICERSHAMDGLAYRSEGGSNRNGIDDSARPGASYFNKGVKAVRSENYKFAVSMYQTSASWAFKPAQYNLGVMHFNGEGVPVDRPRGTAWLALAAERGDRNYVAARDGAAEQLSTEEIARANEILDELKKTYADAVALKRAMHRWRDVRNSATGSHLGAAIGPLRVSSRSPSAPQAKLNLPVERPALTTTQSAFGIIGANSTDGSIAYRQLRESDNPYDPKFKQATGVATVQPLIPVEEKSAPVTKDSEGHDPSP